MPREQDGRQRSSSAYYVASAYPQRPFSALPHSRPRVPVARAAILGFLYRFQRRTNEAIGVSPIFPGCYDLSSSFKNPCWRLHFLWIFRGKVYPSFSKMVEVVRWSDTETTARRLVDCGDYDGDLYREYPLDSEGGFGNIIVVDNLPVMPLENFAKLEGVRCTIKKREARIFR
ncbi:unnamed protein product [Musa acuminata subsp. malaccensis]|uniref:(wild Malaysian banana) hypothetical protein n=1 Tax=Musa acuminata subsp. malaccensis TaxID=214687 RepID=A0A804LAC2_MUSAM|nr:unnamed protein product [Musa acuminata subsp. malaccensis]